MILICGECSVPEPGYLKRPSEARCALCKTHYCSNQECMLRIPFAGFYIVQCECGTRHTFQGKPGANLILAAGWFHVPNEYAPEPQRAAVHVHCPACGEKLAYETVGDQETAVDLLRRRWDARTDHAHYAVKSDIGYCLYKKPVKKFDWIQQGCQFNQPAARQAAGPGGPLDAR